MKTFIAFDTNNNRHIFSAKDAIDAKHWVINHLDTSLLWTVREVGTEKYFLSLGK